MKLPFISFFLALNFAISYLFCPYRQGCTQTRRARLFLVKIGMVVVFGLISPLEQRADAPPQRNTISFARFIFVIQYMGYIFSCAFYVAFIY